MDYTPFFITFKLAVLTTLILFVISIPISYFLAFSKWKAKIILESILMMPIILPPTVLGFYYLNFLGPKTAIGSFFEENLGSKHSARHFLFYFIFYELELPVTCECFLRI